MTQKNSSLCATSTSFHTAMLGTDQPLHPIRPNVPFDDRKLHIHTWALHTTALPFVLFHSTPRGSLRRYISVSVHSRSLSRLTMINTRICDVKALLRPNARKDASRLHLRTHPGPIPTLLHSTPRPGQTDTKLNSPRSELTRTSSMHASAL